MAPPKPSTNFQNILLTVIYLSICYESGRVQGEGHREHKVHNIVLYPDKHSWCETKPIKQVVSYPGCSAITIENNVCVGACFSYSIPHTEPSDPGEVIVPYCDSCQPSETRWIQVKLDCDKNDPDTPTELKKHVQVIQNCSCTSCDKDPYRVRHHKLEEESVDDGTVYQQNEVPDLLHVLNNRSNSSSSPDSSKVKDLVNSHIIKLLQNIQTNNSQTDKEQLMDLLRTVQGPEEKISDKSIADFVDSMNSENIELDIPRLREILIKFEHSKYYKKHTADLDMEEDDQDAMDHGGDNEEHHLHHHTHHHSFSDKNKSKQHVRLPVHVNHEDPANSENDDHLDDMIQKQHHHKHHQHDHPHHHVGDILSNGHLARGPHGALVLQPNQRHTDEQPPNVEEKLNVNPHELKPNHAGTLLSYHSHGPTDVEVGGSAVKKD